jgi:hypothetical protein
VLDAFSHIPILLAAAQLKDNVRSFDIAMSKRFASEDPTADEPMLEFKRQAKKQWNVQPSAFSKSCANPIRKIVDNIKKPATSLKTLIPLSLGTCTGPSMHSVSTNDFSPCTPVLQAIQRCLATCTAPMCWSRRSSATLG